MESLALFVSASGRIAPKPFAAGVAIVYLLSFLSQFLLAAPITARTGIAPFALVQAVLIWAWFALHARRLRDAGRNAGMAVGIAILYSLAIVLLLLVFALLSGAAPPARPGGDPPAGSFSDFLLFLFLIGLISGDPHLGVFGYVIMAFLAIIVTPVLISFGFTVWAGTRASVPPPAPPLP